MDNKEIKDFNRRIASLIAEGKILEALDALRGTAESLRWPDAVAQVEGLRQNYSYMLGYFARGAADPGRDDVIADIREKARAVADLMLRRRLMADDAALYFNTARNCSVRQGESIASLIEACRAEERRLNEDFGSIADPSRRRRAEQLMSDLFARVWTDYPLDSADATALLDFLTSPGTRPAAAAMASSALAMGLMEYYDASRMELLLRAYMQSESDEVALRSLVGFLMAAFRYRRRPLPRRVAEVLAAAKDTPVWRDDFKTVAMEVLRARDTERISRKMRDEVYPTLMKLQGGLQEKIGQGDLDLEALAEGGNPEWEELLSRDGLGDKLKEMTEIQADGGDVFMSTFAHLKRFPFFNDIASWFMPFHDEHTEVARLDGLDGSLGTLLQGMPILCDSDKFSVALSLASLPEGQRKAALDSMRLQGDQAREMLSEMAKANPNGRRKNIINKYLQNLYRFYNLFRRKGEFFDPFGHMVNLLDVDSVAAGFDDVETLEIIGEFSFRHKLWPEAARLLSKVDSLSAPDAGRSQKIGYCYECLGDTSAALSRYEEAELLDGGSRWTLRRLAASWRRAGRPEQAVACYRRLADMLPDDFATTLNLAYALSEAGDMAAAEAQFHKAAYYDPESVAARRGLGWTQFVNRKFDAAADSFAFVIGRDGRPADYLNAGHVARARRCVPEAINFYKLSMLAAEQSADALLATLDADARWLEKAGVDTSENILYVESIKTQL